MDICIVNDRFNMGGVSRVTTQLAHSLLESGNQVSLIDFSGNNEFYYKVNDKIRKPRVIRTRQLKGKIIMKLLNLKFSLDKHPLSIIDFYKDQYEDLITHLQENKYDCLILCQGALTALVPYIKREIPSLKIVVWQHNEYEVYINQYYKKYINDYLNGIKFANLVVCLTEEDRNKFMELNPNSKYIYNPLTITNNEEDISNLKNKNIIFVGRLLTQQKGLDYLIKIGKEINNDWKILVAGDGPDKENLIQMIRENKLETKIILKGTLQNKELVDLYNSGSIFISTSRWEGFGLVVTEAMSFGLPIISFETRGPKEILKNGKYGLLIEKNNIKEFCEKLNQLINDPVTRKVYQDKSLERSQHFNKDVILSEWISILEKL